MTRTSYSVFADDELVELLIDEPQLLAIADALVATKSKAPPAARHPYFWPSRQRRRTRIASIVGALAVVVAAVALLLISPWQGSTSVVQRALAAVGSQPVLHVVIAQSAPPAASILDLNTGQAIPRSLRTEIWFDHQRDLKKTVVTLNSKILDELLETEKGGLSRGGPLYTCAWIAAHPVEATKARVSCNASGNNGTTPREVPEQPPSLDQALAGFVDRYQAALASGEARQIGTGQVDGRDIVWLQFDAEGTRERVAVDAQSYRPLLLEANEGAVSFRVLTAETLPYDPSFFTKPEQVRAQSGGSVSSEVDVSPQQAATSLGGMALWLGGEWNDLKLVGTTMQERTIAYGGGSQPGRASVIKFTYAPVAADGTVDIRASVEIYETTTCLVSVGWTCTPLDPSAADTLGLPLGLQGPIDLLHRDGLYVSIWNSGNSELSASIDMAWALEPLITDH